MARSQGSHAQGVRLIKMLRRLQGRIEGIRLAELQDEFGLSRSQLRRDLLALEEAGTRLTIEQEQGRYGHGRVRLLDADTTAIPVTRSERYTLLAARGFFDIFRGSQLHDDMESIFDKVLQTMPTRTRKDTRSLQSKIFFRPSGGTKSYEAHRDIINALLTGLLMERLVSFTYRQRSGRKSSGVMAPYAMVIHRNGLYLVAQRKQDADGNDITQEPRVFAVERFLEADWLRRTSFDYPTHFRVEDHFDDAFGLISGRKTHHVVVDLDKSVRVEAEARAWHRTQTQTAIPGGTRIEFDVTSLREVVPWVLEWGQAARVIEPVELRRRVIDALKSALANYPA